MSTRLSNLIETQLSTAFSPTLLKLVNQSHLHAGHAGDDGSGETHYDLLLVSAAFEGMNRVKRHQAVYAQLDAAFARGLHALSMQLLTPTEAAQGLEGA